MKNIILTIVEYIRKYLVKKPLEVTPPWFSHYPLINIIDKRLASTGLNKIVPDLNHIKNVVEVYNDITTSHISVIGESKCTLFISGCSDYDEEVMICSVLSYYKPAGVIITCISNLL